MALRLFIALTLARSPLLAAPAVPAAAAEKRVALVIGNGRYANAPLPNPANDAADMAAVLEDLGFEVILKRDAGKRAMEEAVKAFYRKLQGDRGIGLFYYAGHGLQVHGQNYLVPVDADIDSEGGDVAYRAVEAGWVLRKMEDAGNPVNIVVLDACRNNPFTRGFRSAEKGLAQMPWTSSSLMGRISLATAAATITTGPKANGDDMLDAERARLAKEKEELAALKAKLAEEQRLVEERARSEAETGGGAYVWTGRKWEKEAGRDWDNPGFSQTDRHPVTCVSWNDAQAFIRWLSGKAQGTYRLPTEAEWEAMRRTNGTSMT